MMMLPAKSLTTVRRVRREGRGGGRGVSEGVCVCVWMCVCVFVGTCVCRERAGVSECVLVGVWEGVGG